MAQFRFNNLVNSQTANDVFAIHKNEQGYWLGTGSGLLRFYSNEDGNPDSISAKLYTNSTVHGILEDNRGNLWVSTNQGLMRLNPQEQTKQTYNNGNGLAVTEFSDGAFYKDNATGTWRVIYRFTNWKGERKQTQKRGFATKREAQAWEHEAMLKQGAKLDMTFASFFEVYETDKKQRVKESTWESKSHVIRTKILPYFGNRKIAEIEAKDIIAWQNELMAYRDEKGKPYSADYLKTIHAQLTAIFNHAVNFYNLPYNPARRAGTMGNEVPKEMDFWTKEEYKKFPL